MKEKFELCGRAVCGSPPPDERAALRELWTKEKPFYSGRYVKFSDVLEVTPLEEAQHEQRTPK